MKKLIWMTTIALGYCAALSVNAQQMPVKEQPPPADISKDGMHPKDGMGMMKGPVMGMKMNMKMMDTNGDGMISKDEFMKYHEAMFDKMKKDGNGMVSVKDMGMMHDMPMKK